MRALLAASVALAAAVALASIAAAGPGATKQRVAITWGAPSDGFVLTPLRAGALERDSGSLMAGMYPERFVIRDGQRAAIFDDVVTFKGRRGNLVAWYRTETVDAGNGYHVSTGTWKVVRGTGQYARITGGGRIGEVWPDTGAWSSRLEGLLTRQ